MSIHANVLIPPGRGGGQREVLVIFHFCHNSWGVISLFHLVAQRSVGGSLPISIYVFLLHCWIVEACESKEMTFYMADIVSPVWNFMDTNTGVQ